MSRLIAYYQLQDLFVDRALLGIYRWTTKPDGAEWRFHFPRDPEDSEYPRWRFDPCDSLLKDAPLLGVSQALSIRPGDDPVAITAMLIARKVEGDGIDRTNFATEETQGVLMGALQAVDAEADRFVAILRARSQQYWLGLSGQLTVRMGPPALWTDAGDQLPAFDVRVLRFPRPVAAVNLSDFELAVTHSHFNDLLPRVQQSLLDAMQMCNELRREDEALMLAAAALEYHIKSRLLELASESLKPAIELMITNRNLQWSAIDHYGPVLRVAAGRDLKSEDSALWKRLDNLIVDRNSIIHAAQGRTRKAATIDHLNTALEVTMWLQSLTPASGGSDGDGSTEASA